LPGVGHFDHGMKQLHNSGMIELLNQKVVNDNVPILGICLGAQMMCKGSEEGNLTGLSWFDAEVKKFNFDQINNPRIPHMGWNYVKQMKDSKISKEMTEESKFYFVHSYHMVSNDDNDVLFKTNYGYDFVSGLENESNLPVSFTQRRVINSEFKCLKILWLYEFNQSNSNVIVKRKRIVKTVNFKNKLFGRSH
jgi:glutamine amidotransferase